MTNIAATISSTSNQSSFTYLPRRDLPTSSRYEAPTDLKYTIIDREPGEDGYPRYILRQSSVESTSEDSLLLRITIFDIEDFVSKYEIEAFENTWFAHDNPDFTSFKEWNKAIKTAKRTGAYVFRRSPNIQVVVHQNAEQIRQSQHLPIIDQRSPVSRRFSAAIIESGLAQADSSPSLAPPQGMITSQTRPDAADYEVAEIVNHKDVLGNLYFQVVWAGFADSDATWLTEEELAGASWAIDAYFKKFESDAAYDDSFSPDEEHATSPSPNLN